MLDPTLRTRIERSVRRERLISRLKAACFARGVHVDVGDGEKKAIDLMPAPLALRPGHVERLTTLSEAIKRPVRRMPGLYARHPEIREVLVFPEPERRWIEDVWRDEHEGRQSVVSRNDLDAPADPKATVAFETNGCAIGGQFYAAESARVLDELVLSAHRDLCRGFEPLPDPCALTERTLLAHADSIGLAPPRSIGILENREWDLGITEMPSLAAYLRAKGLRCTIGDPRALAVRGGRFRLDGNPVDLLYRNMELADFIDLEAEGHRLDAVREAFRRNVVVSGIAGDFDQKSVWEVLTSARTRRFIDPGDRRILTRHLLWTRLLRETRTEGPDGAEVDLVAFTRANRRRLVLKPNLSCGGEGVTLGPLLDARRWSRAVDRALRETNRWVVQRFHPGAKLSFPLPRVRGDAEPHYVTFGVISQPFGGGILGRACLRPIVNVSRGGGLAALFVKR